MNILVVGGGGREHAIIKKLKENPAVETVYALPGNGGIAADAVCVPIGACEIDRIAEFAGAHSIGFAVVAPDDPLVAGMVDALEDAGGFLPLNAKSDLAAIRDYFSFSKRVFKQVIGMLYKEGRITISEDGIRLNPPQEEKQP